MDGTWASPPAEGYYTVRRGPKCATGHSFFCPDRLGYFRICENCGFEETTDNHPAGAGKPAPLPN